MGFRGVLPESLTALVLQYAIHKHEITQQEPELMKICEDHHIDFRETNLFHSTDKGKYIQLSDDFQTATIAPNYCSASNTYASYGAVRASQWVPTTADVSATIKILQC